MKKNMPIYLDNAATSFPKPESVYQAVQDTLQTIGGSPGRSNHKWGRQINEMIFEVRRTVADFFNISNPSCVIFTHSCTEALNLGIKGLLEPGDHAITSSMEHNSVLRPLGALAKNGIETTGVPCSKDGYLDPQDVEKAIKGNTRLIVMNYASNVTGGIHPIKEIGRIAKEKDIVFLVDAAQAAGLIPIDVQTTGIDMLACPGHKGLLGPQGTGFLYVRDGIELTPLLEGGTGWDSENETQPLPYPERFESGTLNTPGIKGLGAGIRFIQEKGLRKIREHEKSLMAQLKSTLTEFRKLEFYGPQDLEEKTGIVSFNIRGLNPLDAGFILDEVYDILVRVGLHCAPMAHKAIGTFPKGCIRVSFGYWNTFDEINLLCEAIKEIVRQHKLGI